MVLRYTSTTETPDDLTYDIVWWDRLTGKRLYSYDGADPANTHASYGAITDEEVFERRGLNIHEEVDMSLCVIPVSEFDVEYLKNRKEKMAEREKEDEESQDLLDFLGDDAEGFNFREYLDGERDILRPALVKRGYKHITFYMGEEDSFGPLSRGARAQDPEGKWVRFYYG